MTVCAGLTTALTDAGGGTWSTADITASVDVSSGVVTGISAGTATITYTLPTGCVTTAVVTINPLPSAITGSESVCIGLTTTLNSTPSGGVWNTTAESGSLIDGGGGIFTGSTAGTADVTYTLGTGCIITGAVTINSNPGAITGTLSVCVGLTTSLNSTPAGGTWSTSSGGASIDASGVATGLVAGTTMVTYTLATGCINTAVLTVNPNPTAITGTASMCVGLSTTLNSTPAGGAWTETDGTGSATGGAGGVFTGATAGTASVTYTVSTGCIITGTVTVNPNPTAITGTPNVCIGLSTTLNSTPAGGAWTSSAGSGIVTGGAGGVFNGLVAGTAHITYTLGTGCKVTGLVTVNPNPTAITGTASMCVGLSTTLNSTPAGGAWSTTAGTGSVTGGAGGVFTGATAGVANVTYTLGTGCIVAGTVTVNPNPTAITGTPTMCVGLSTTLNATPAGGTWTTTGGTGSVTGGAGGVFTGSTAGDANITYTLGTGCLVSGSVTVNPNPTAITGAPSMCVGLSTTLNSTPAGGNWTTTAGTGSVTGDGTGMFTGVTAGTANVTYVLGTGCLVTGSVTVNPNPTAITGTPTMCVGLSTTLNSTPAGGTWSSSPGAGSVTGGVGGVFTGATAGDANITYTIGTGCLVTGSVTVNPNPTAITGTASMCVGLSATLSSTPAGGSWATTAGSGSVTGGAGGVFTGATAGTANVTYTLGTGCIVTGAVTVNPNPTAITGTPSMCVGLTTTLNSTPAGGTWSTSDVTIVSVASGSGVVTGLLAGTATITYTISTGCIMTAVVTVNPLPLGISGSGAVCVGSTTGLSDGMAGGTWVSSDPAIAVIGSSSGSVTGVIAGTVVITYTLPTGCMITSVETVNPLPSAITGPLAVCASTLSGLSDPTPGGTWSSVSPGVASIGSGTGAVIGLTAGTTVISYTISTGCAATAIVTVNPLLPITGGLTVCAGATTNLNNATPGGTWTSSTTSVATVGSGSGAVSGILAGTTVISYILPTGCNSGVVVTVNPAPSAIAGTLSVCSGLTTTLSDGVAGGTWSSSASGTASVGSGTGIVTGGTAGTATIVYTLPAGCSTSALVTVNPLPTAILGTLSVCAGSTTGLSDAAAGGTWASSDGTIATVGTDGVVTGVAGGSATITYTLPTGCMTTALVIVNPLPGGVTGTLSVCAGLTTTLSDIPAGGTWTSTNLSSATVGSSSGVVTGVAAGTATLVYTLPTSCAASAIVTVNPLPGTITGITTVCAGSTTTLSDPDAGGNWSSSDGTIATVGSSSGVVTGVAGGSVTITYTLPTGCIITALVNVNPLPGAIAGTLSVCAGLTTGLSDAVAGGTWSSSASGTASVGSSSGVVTGVVAGTATIVYMLPTGCSVSAVVTVNPLPGAITGTMSVCEGSTTGLSDATAGGTWGSSTTSVATVDAGGVVTGVLAGTTTITYTLPTGCIMTAVVVVNPQPAGIVGGGTIAVCTGLTVSLTDTTSGGTWSSSDTTIVNISGAGVATGEVSGTATITYTLPAGCMSTTVVTVNTSPSTIGGVFSVCAGLTIELTDGITGGTWSSSTTSVISIVSGSGIATTLSAGTSVISYTLPSGCTTSAVVTVNPLPMAILGADTVCLSLTTTLSDATTGGNWISSSATTASIDPSTGVVTGLALGTVTITYTLSTGCSTTMVMSVDACNTGVKPVVLTAGIDVRVFPNPNKGEFTVRGTLGTTTDAEVSLEVADMLGQVIYKGNVTAREGKLDVQLHLSNTLANGMYILNLRTGDEYRMFHFVIEQ